MLPVMQSPFLGGNQREPNREPIWRLGWLLLPNKGVTQPVRVLNLFGPKALIEKVPTRNGKPKFGHLCHTQKLSYHSYPHGLWFSQIPTLPTTGDTGASACFKNAHTHHMSVFFEGAPFGAGLKGTRRNPQVQEFVPPYQDKYVAWQMLTPDKIHPF